MAESTPQILQDKQSYTGRSLSDLPTPALLVDRAVLQANIASMQTLVSSHGKALRPHIKTHKCGNVARLQLRAGAIGVTCATISEAEAMARAGVRDILVANQLVTRDKLLRAVRLAQICDLKFAVDSEAGIRIADEVGREFGVAFEVLVEVDSGGKRCGAQSPQEAVSLVNEVLKRPGLRFGGIQAYNGGTSYIKDLDERRARVAASDQILADALEAVRTVSAIPRVSGAGTGNSLDHLRDGQLTEIQAGSYVYSDTTYRELSPAYGNALFVLATVLSVHPGGRVVLDAGLKSIGTEFSSPLLPDYPYLEGCRFSEEHQQWSASSGPLPQVGEKVRIIPSHCCTTVNLYRRCFVIENETVMDVWEIDAF